MNTHLAILIAWASLMFSTPLAIVALRVTRNSNGQTHKRLLWVCAALLVIVICSLANQVNFTNLGANVCALVLAYLSYCYFAVSAWRIKRKLVRFSALAVAHIPVALGYVLGTIGFLGLMFIVGDKTTPSIKIEQLTSNLTCEVRGWGMAASDSGYTVNLKKQWQLLPFIEKTVYSVVINETQAFSSGEGTDCQSAFAVYQKKGRSNFTM